MGYPPLSSIAVSPSPEDSGTVLAVTADEWVRFPVPPFNALAWPSNEVPYVGGNAEEPIVLSVDQGTFTLQRGSPAIALTEGLQFASLGAIDVYDLDEVLFLSYTDADGEAGTCAFQVRHPQGTLETVVDASGQPFEGTVGLVEEGLWHWRALSDGNDPGPEHTIFVRFSPVV